MLTVRLLLTDRMDSVIISRLIEEKQLKPYLSFLKLARDCLTSAPLVSYWSLYYVLEKGIKKQTQDEQFRHLLGLLMTALEKEKATRKGDQLFSNEEESKKFVENYANQMLVRAENEAQLGVSLTSTIKLYLVASNVSQLLTLFGDSSEQNAKRIKYCKWKAVTIAKEIKQQEAEQSGQSDNEDQTDDVSDYDEQSSDTDVNETVTQKSTHLDKPSDNKALEVHSQPNKVTSVDLAKLTLPDSDLKKAELLCESALYAIRGKDILTAVTSLKQTLQALQKSARN